MRITVVLALAACQHGGSTPPPNTGDHGLATHEALAGDDDFRPSYGKDELQKALIAERAAEATAEQAVMNADMRGDDDATRAARADLAVRRRFIAALEACDAAGHRCPPRLDDPPWSYDVASDADPRLDAQLRFDRDSWQKVATELHGRACACRTVACVESLEVVIGKLEDRPMPDVRGDEVASQSITRARECLVRLRGKARTYNSSVD